MRSKLIVEQQRTAALQKDLANRHTQPLPVVSHVNVAVANANTRCNTDTMPTTGNISRLSENLLTGILQNNSTVNQPMSVFTNVSMARPEINSFPVQPIPLQPEKVHATQACHDHTVLPPITENPVDNYLSHVSVSNGTSTVSAITQPLMVPMVNDHKSMSGEHMLTACTSSVVNANVTYSANMSGLSVLDTLPASSINVSYLLPIPSEVSGPIFQQFCQPATAATTVGATQNLLPQAVSIGHSQSTAATVTRNELSQVSGTAATQPKSVIISTPGAWLLKFLRVELFILPALLQPQW